MTAARTAKTVALSGLLLWGTLLAAERAARAQSFQQGDSLFDVQLLHPGPAPGDFLNVRGTKLPGHLEFALSAHLTYMYHPLVTPIYGTDQRNVIVEHQLGLEISAAYSLWGRLMVGIGLPVTILQNCRDAQAENIDTCRDLSPIGLSDANFQGGGLGDVRLTLRGVIIKPGASGGLGLGLGAIVSLPTADATAFVGAGNREDLRPDGDKVFSPTGTFYAIGDYSVGRVRFGINAGYLVRRDGKLTVSGGSADKQIAIGDQLLYGLGVGLRVTKWLEGIVEVDGRQTVTDFATRNSPHEALGSARFWFGNVRVDAGVGVGFLGNYGAPRFRAFTGVAYAGGVTTADADGDGIGDDRDQCPDEAEDKDGHEDNDGCPEFDDDDDGIPDQLDKCPRVPAVTADGCPLQDSDGDGLADDRDRCPKEPEDKDGFEDDDGCPEADNDRDGLADAKDKCPNKPETFNGYQDDDGCPDEAPVVKRPTVPVITATGITIPQRITFRLGKAELTAASKKVLDDVAKLINKHPELKLVRIEGHTDNVGGRRRNLRLSRARARSVLGYLVSKGVSRKRLQAVGYGSSRPIASNATSAGRAKNRRVEFIIVQRGGKR